MICRDLHKQVIYQGKVRVQGYAHRMMYQYVCQYITVPDCLRTTFGQPLNNTLIMSLNPSQVAFDVKVNTAHHFRRLIMFESPLISEA